MTTLGFGPQWAGRLGWRGRARVLLALVIGHTGGLLSRAGVKLGSLAFVLLRPYLPPELVATSLDSMRRADVKRARKRAKWAGRR